MRKWVMIHLTQSESKRFLKKKKKERKEKKKPNSFDAFPSEENRLEENTPQMRQLRLILFLPHFTLR